MSSCRHLLVSGTRGFTLVEALVALAILGIAAVMIAPALTNQLQANNRSELRSGAVSVVEQTLEALRLQDPETLPTSSPENPTPVLVMVGGREYEAITRYCVRDEFCEENSRHLTVEVRYNGLRIFDAETVFTKLR